MIAAASAPRIDGPKPKWTVLLYGAADNNLQSAMIGNVTDLETVGSDEYTNLVTQFDFGDQCNRYLLQKATNPEAGQISTAPMEQLGPVNMSDPQTLKDFIVWGQKTFPAENYMVIISDHGNGWQGACEDDSHNGWLTMPQIREAFEGAKAETGQKVGIIGFDACLMASAEVAHELKDVCDFQVSSEETEGAAGWPYSRIANPELLKNVQQMHLMKINVEPRDLAVQCVKDAQGTQEILPTMTAIDSAKVGDVTAAIDNLAKAIVATDTDPAVLSSIVSDTQSFTDYKDAADFAIRLAADEKKLVADDNLKAAAKAVVDAIGNAVIAEEHSDSYPNAKGLTLEISNWGARDGYDKLKFAQDTQWPAALAKLASGGNGGVHKS